MTVAKRSASGRRTAPFVAGLVVLGAFLAALVGVFLDEDQARARDTDGQRAALEAYASATLRRALDDEWRLGVALMESALADPLRDDTRLLLVSDGERLLPRRAAGADEGVVVEVAALLSAPEADPGSPAGERRAFVRALAAALDAKHPPAIEAAVRGLLSHRRQYRLGPRDDLSTALAMVELLQTRTTPARVLLERVLRDGFGPGEPGLQREVLLASARLSPEALRAVCAVVEQQSRRAQVPVDDFVERCVAVRRGDPPLPAEAPEGLSWRPGWVLRGGRELRGVAVSAEALLRAQEVSMRERGLLGAGDGLDVASRAGLVADLQVQVQSPRWSAAATSRATALRLKLGLLVLAFGLGVGLVGLAFVVQRREQALVEAKHALVATVSHELRTPLASLRVMAETLERKLERVPEAKDWPRRIVGEVDGLTALVENILSFNRLERGREVLHPVPWRLAEVKGWLDADAGPEVQLRVTGAEGVVLDADPTWMKVAFLNLLRNARKYNERTPVTFEVHARREGPRVVIEVRDNGIGIAPQAWREVFEAFHRLRDGRGRGGGGSGLGLALVKQVVEGHGGEVRVGASSPEGTTFVIELPCRVS